MAPSIGAFVTLDVVSAALTLLVSFFFVDAWRKTGNALNLLFALGFALVGLSFGTTSASEFDLGRAPGLFDVLRLAGQLGGALVLAFAYLSARIHAQARPWLVLGWTVGVISLLTAFGYFVLPPTSAFPSLKQAFPIAHAVMTAAYLVCAMLAGAGFVKQPSRDRLLVPAAFLAWAATKYTWLLADLTNSTNLAPFVYFWRFLAILLLMFALRAPRRLRGERVDAA